MKFKRGGGEGYKREITCTAQDGDVNKPRGGNVERCMPTEEEQRCYSMKGKRM